MTRPWNTTYTAADRLATNGFEVHWTTMGERTLIVFGYRQDRLWSWHLRDGVGHRLAAGDLDGLALADALDEALVEAAASRIYRVPRGRGNRAVAPANDSASRLRAVAGRY